MPSLGSQLTLSISSFDTIDQSPVSSDSGAHVTVCNIHAGKLEGVPAGTYFLKTQPESSLSDEGVSEAFQTEAAYAALFNRLLKSATPEEIPATCIAEHWLVTNEAGNVVGLLTRAIPGFTPLAGNVAEVIRTKQNIDQRGETIGHVKSKEELVTLLNTRPFPEVIAIGYLLEDDDQHAKNLGLTIGTDGQPYVARIDLGEAGIGLDIEKNKNYLDEFKGLYLVTQRNVDHFPQLETAPNGGFRTNWIETSFNGLIPNYEALLSSEALFDETSIVEFEEYASNAFDTFARLTERDIASIISAYVDPESPLGVKIIERVESRAHTLQEILHPPMTPQPAEIDEALVNTPVLPRLIRTETPPGVEELVKIGIFAQEEEEALPPAYQREMDQIFNEGRPFDF